LTDLNAALAAKPDYTEAQLMRGSANACIGNYDAAIADYTALIQSQNLAAGYSGRALAYWRRGSFKEAAADFAQTAQLVPHNPYNAVWLAVTEGRAGTLDTAQISAVMATAMAHRSDDKNFNWPAPLVDLFLGKTTADQVVAAGEGGEEVGRASRRCEAYFYTGQWWLSRGDTMAAKPLFDKAVDQCPKSDLELDAAKAEQKKLK
jgi:lipoprotein NlpI